MVNGELNVVVGGEIEVDAADDTVSTAGVAISGAAEVVVWATVAEQAASSVSPTMSSAERRVCRTGDFEGSGMLIVSYRPPLHGT